MNNDIKRDKRKLSQRPKVWQDIVVKKPSPIKTLPSVDKIPKKTIFKIPKIKINYKFKKIKFPKKKSIYVIIIVVVLATFSMIYLISYMQADSKKKNSEIKDKISKLETSNPSFSSITRDGLPATWKIVSPPGADPVYAYTDKINDVSISVSQQPIPDSFKPNIEENVEGLAQNFDADIKYKAEGIIIYVGTSAKEYRPQSAILVKNNLLILIKSKSPISEQDWIKYVNSLR